MGCAHQARRFRNHVGTIHRAFSNRLHSTGKLLAYSMVPQATSSAEFTLRDLWRSMMPRLGTKGSPSVPRWPPDVFALCAYSLRQAAAYVHVLSNWPPRGTATPEWGIHCEEVAGAWQHAIAGREPTLPDSVLQCWSTIAKGFDRPLSELRGRESRVAQAIVELMAYADQACRPFTAPPGEEPVDSVLFESLGLIQLQKNGWRSVCNEIDPSRLRVLPKSRVPQRGLTIRSLSLYASLVEGAEIETTFYDNRQWGEDLKINVLVLPWPFEVLPSQFRPNDRLPAEMGTMSSDFGFFTYEGRHSGRSFIPGLRRLLEEAISDCGRISMVILPELALTAREATNVRELLAGYECVLITGVGAAGISGHQRGSNRVQLYSPGMKPVEQEKHHRWKLDNSQIMQYSLGSSLYHAKAWWEHIDLSTRRLSFVRLAPWLNICALICEDLARPDPAGDIVRAVAPNLVVSLLMDGPQLMSRWASRHAATLAEDPGSSVLTITSLGMARLSRPSNGASRDRVIALWKEEGASAVEIELPDNRRAVVLSVSMKACKDWSADGRLRQSAIPSLTGVRFLKGDRLPADR